MEEIFGSFDNASKGRATKAGPTKRMVTKPRTTRQSETLRHYTEKKQICRLIAEKTLT